MFARNRALACHACLKKYPVDISSARLKRSGTTGYAGGELVRILTGHKDVEIKWFGSRSYIDKKYADVYRNMFQIVDAVCLDDNMEQLADQVDVIFTATPQGLCSIPYHFS